MNFASKITNWYENNKRTLPWRENTDPYFVWLSEIILQQTRVDQGLSYFIRFSTTFPDIKSLASADEETVLKLWQGLGYYSRARNLHRTAIIIAEQFDGRFPSDYQEVIKLPGIGEYTAAAVLSIAFNQAYPVIDGNVIRVISRIFGIEGPLDRGKGLTVLKEKAHTLLDHEDPGTYNQAVMEFGALHCTPVKPACSECIFAEHCFAYKHNRVDRIPAKKKPVIRRIRYFYYFLPVLKGNVFTKIMINKRGDDDIWKNLYDFPLIESKTKLSLRKIKQRKWCGINLINIPVKFMGTEYKHILSHQVIQARFIRLELGNSDWEKLLKSVPNEATVFVEIGELKKYPIPRLIDKFLEENRNVISSGQ
jgi:A/G-specific adenine glycosylase